MTFDEIIDSISIKPYYLDREAGQVIYCSDNRLILPLLPEKSIDLVFTSPPYNLGNAVKGSFYGGKGKGLKIEYLSHDDGMPDEEYIEWQHNTFKLIYRVILDTGAIFYNHKPRITNGFLDDRKNLIPFPVRQEIVWDRCGMVNFSGSFFAPNTERIYIVAKEHWKPQKKYLGWGEIWRVTPETDNKHPAPFPKKLADRVIVSASEVGGVILDPFLGSGTTLVCAKKLGRKAIGIEIEEKYCSIAAKRLSQSVMRLE